MATVEPRRNKQGVITSWRITISDGYRPDKSQKRIFRTFHADPNKTENAQRKQAEKYAARLETECEDKKINDAKKITFSKVYEEYSDRLDDLVFSGDLAQQTADSYKKLFNNRLLKEFGGMAIREIETDDIDRFLRRLSKDRKPRTKTKSTVSEKKELPKKLSGTYRLKYFQQLNGIFKYAKHQKYITINPCDNVEKNDKPKRDTQEAQYYELNECAKIMDLLSVYTDPKWKAYFSLSFYCGCRPGEIIGLNWSDYDGENIYIQAGSYQGKGEKCKRTEKPKTKKSKRRIMLAPEAVTALNAWKAEQAKKRLKCGKCWQNPEAVFTNDEGERIRPQAPTKAWKNFTTENKLRHLPLYDLRHTNCSMLIASRELSVEEVSARMGHEQTSTTLNIYTHAFANYNKRATTALANVLKAAANDNQ